MEPQHQLKNECYCDACVRNKHAAFSRRFWFTMIVFLLLIVLGITAAYAQARTASITFVAPSTWEDGTPFDCNTVNCSYSLYRGTCGGSKTRVASGIRATTSLTAPNSSPGDCFSMTTTVGSVESPQGNELRYKGSAGAPTITVIVTVSVEAQSP